MCRTDETGFFASIFSRTTTTIRFDSSAGYRQQLDHANAHQPIPPGVLMKALVSSLRQEMAMSSSLSGCLAARVTPAGPHPRCVQSTSFSSSFPCAYSARCLLFSRPWSLRFNWNLVCSCNYLGHASMKAYAVSRQIPSIYAGLTGFAGP